MANMLLLVALASNLVLVDGFSTQSAPLAVRSSRASCAGFNSRVRVYPPNGRLPVLQKGGLYELKAAATAPETSGIETVTANDMKTLQKTAAFFVDAFYRDYKAEAVLTQDQRNRLGGEQYVDMRQRYGNYISLPSAMLIARGDDGEIMGCAGVEIALVNPNNKIMPKTKQNLDACYDLRPLLANVAVSPESRGRGLGKQLCQACEDTVRSWGYEELLLLVEAENTPALRLYKKLGYSEVWRDNEATASKAVAYAGGAALQKVLQPLASPSSPYPTLTSDASIQVTVTNIAMRKDLNKKPGMFGLGMFGL